MEIHKPKPWHGLREFLKEYVIVVIGVLTALGAEQAVEWMHWQEAVSEAREALHHEIGSQTAYFRERLQVAACLERHLRATERLIDHAARNGRTDPVAGVAMRLGERMDIGEWTSEQAAQTLVRFPRGERALLTSFYQQTADLAGWRDEEARVWDDLAVLEGPSKRLSDAELDRLRSKVKRAEHLAGLWSRNAQRQLDRAAQLGVQGAAPEPRTVAGACQDITPL